MVKCSEVLQSCGVRLFNFFIVVYMVVCFVLLLFNSVGYVSLLLCLCILTLFRIFCTLFCIFCFHRANWHSPATLTEVFPCFFLSCKANARVYIAKTGHDSNSS